MKRKDKDLLIQMAFDEENASSIGQFSAAQQQEYAQLRQIKEDMGLLRDMPECQLSIETVRDAILGSEMKAPRHRIAALVWAAPLCAGLLLFGILNLNRSGQPSVSSTIPSAIVSQGPVASNTAFDVEKFLPNSIVASVASASEQFSATNAPQVRQSAAVATYSSLGHRPTQSFSRSMTSPRFEAMAARAVESGTAIPHESVAAHPTVVIINPDVNGDTGAKTANEVETGSNVVIGG